MPPPAKLFRARQRVGQLPRRDPDARPPGAPTPCRSPPPMESFGHRARLAAGHGGVRRVTSQFIAIGRTSVMRVTFAGDINGLADGVALAGWQVNQGSSALGISR